MSEAGQYKYYNIITIVFIISLVISNLAATKVCDFAGITLPGGIIIFTILYVLNDVLTEVYGFSSSRRVVWTALLCNFVLSVFLYCVTFFPPSDHWQDQIAFEKIFSLSPRIFFASMISYLIGELVNAAIISLLKLRMQGKFFAIRAIISTAIGSFIESIIFCYVAFSNFMTLEQILKMALTLTIVKTLYEIIIMPVTTKLVGFLKQAENLDVYELPSFKALTPSVVK